MTNSAASSLRPVCAARELDGGRLAGVVPLVDLLDPGMSDAERRRVAYYLLQAETAIYTLTVERDVFDDETTYLSASWKADDRWFWRHDLVHYVLKYGCRLPAGFLEWCASQSWRPPALDEDRLGEIARAVGNQVFGRAP